MIREYCDEVRKLTGEAVELVQFSSGRRKAFVEINNYSKAADGQITIYVQTVHTMTPLNVTYFTLAPFPGCCAFMISTAVHVFDPYKNRGVNGVSNKFRQDLARAWGYTTLICTDVDTNTFERKTLARNGWRDIYQVENRRTKNLVNITIKEL